MLHGLGAKCTGGMSRYISWLSTYKSSTRGSNGDLWPRFHDALCRMSRHVSRAISITPLQSALLVGSDKIGRWLRLSRERPSEQLCYRHSGTIVEGHTEKVLRLFARRESAQSAVRCMRKFVTWNTLESLRAPTYDLRLFSAWIGEPSLCTDLLEKVCSLTTYKSWWRSGTLVPNETEGVTRRAGGSALRQIDKLNKRCGGTVVTQHPHQRSSILTPLRVGIPHHARACTARGPPHRKVHS